MKQIQELIKATQVLRVEGNSDTRVSRLAYDSRRIAPGDCFFAVSGTQSDGHAYIDAAVTAGAAAVVCQRLPEHLAPSVCYVVVADTNAAMADMAAAFYGDPSRQLKLVGITGTNGKTTTVTLLYDLFRGLGYKVGLISTVVYRIDTERIESTHTTPDAIRLNEMMARMVEAGCEYCFMEVSSHAIVQERIRGLHFTGGIFSNITHDHLDYHKTFAEYIRAKKLFFDNLPKEAFALINIDDRNGRVMVQNTRATVKTLSLQSMADFRCKILETHPDGMELRIDGREVWVHFLGRFNAYNLLCVYAAALLLGADREGHAENQNANTAKVQGQRDVTADDTGQVHLGAGGGIHTANGKVAVQAQRKAEGRDQVAHQGGVVYRGIQGVHAAEGEVQQLHDKPHRCRNCHSKCSVHEQNVFFLKGLPVAHCFSLLIRSGVPPQTFCGDQPIISLIFS